ncbi:MAG: hypothetical protein C4523_09145 [Myxococcales bacterium]|nr:MAG: hypothetical protein C4523_09145 [Myxococcales bacterium]
MLKQSLVLLALLFFIFALGGCDDSNELPLNPGDFYPPGTPGATCTEGPCCQNSVIVANGTACDDGSDLTGNDECQGGQCNGTPCVCNTEDECCDGCFAINNGGSCESDDLACTTDACMAGACTHEITDGFCLIEDACFAQNQPNPTNVCLFCDPTRFVAAWSALPNGAACSDGEFCTVGDTCMAGACQGGGANDCVAALPNIDAQCQARTCDEANDVCVAANINEGMVCNDGFFCTVNDTCNTGACAGAARDCTGLITEDQCEDAFCDEDNDLCTVVNTNQGQTCDDGLFCTVNDTCNLGACNGGARDCSNSVSEPQCQLPVCDEELDQCEALSANNGGGCNDANRCTVGDMCITGVCSGAPMNCTGLADQCNDGVCNPDTGACNAVAAREGIACEDGNFCTVNEVCLEGECYGTDERDCTFTVDDPACQFAFCDPTANLGAGDCVQQDKANGTVCVDDGIACTNDVCDDGLCEHVIDAAYCLIGGVCYNAGDWNPADPCFACNIASPTVWTARAAGANCEVDDDELECTKHVCNAEHVCELDIVDNTCLIGGVCYADGEKPEGDTCRECDDDVENGQTQWTNVAEGTVCDDDDTNFCTTGECHAGACVIENKDDGTACDDLGDTVIVNGNTDDYGEEDQDDNECTKGECAAGVCQNVNIPNTQHEACEDGVFCTINEECVDGACTGGVPRQSVVGGGAPYADDEGCDDDDDACTTNYCDEFFGCWADDIDCAEPADDLCQWHACVEGAPEDDPATAWNEGDTAYTCELLTPDTDADPLTGPIDDDDACTIDECDPLTGDAVYTDVVCDDDDLCTDDVCEFTIGCVYLPVECTPYDDTCETAACDTTTGECVREWDADKCPCCDCLDDPDCPCLTSYEDAATELDCDDGVGCTIEVCDRTPGVGTECNTDELVDDVLDGENIDDTTAERVADRNRAVTGTVAKNDFVAIDSSDDWWYLEACAGEQLTVTIAFDNDASNLSLFGFRADGVTDVGSSENFTGNTESFDFTAPASEIYYFQVVNEEVALACSDYDLTITSAGGCTEEFGPTCNDGGTDLEVVDDLIDCGDPDCDDALDTDALDNNDWCKAEFLSNADPACGTDAVDGNFDDFTPPQMPLELKDLVVGRDANTDTELADWFAFPWCQPYGAYSATLTVTATFTHAEGDIDLYLFKADDDANDGFDSFEAVNTGGGAIKDEGTASNVTLTASIDSTGTGFYDANALAMLAAGNGGAGIQPFYLIQAKIKPSTDPAGAGVLANMCNTMDLTVNFNNGDDADEGATGNNTAAEATAFPVNTTLSNRVVWGDDSVPDLQTNDFYMFEACAGAQVAVKMIDKAEPVGFAEDTDMRLMRDTNADGLPDLEVGAHADAATETTGTLVLANAGTYWVEVTLDSANNGFCSRAIYNLQVLYDDSGCVETGCGDGAEACCSDGLDTEGDGAIDCADEDCDATNACNEAMCIPNPEDADLAKLVCCTDGVDNEGNGVADCVDPNCDDGLEDNEADPTNAAFDEPDEYAYQVNADFVFDEFNTAEYTELVAADDDHYEVPVCDGAPVSILVEFDGEAVNIDLRGYKYVDPDLLYFLQSQTPTGDSESIQWVATYDGVVYFQVENDGGLPACGYYSMTITNGEEESTAAGNCDDGIDNDCDGLEDTGVDPDCP